VGKVKKQEETILVLVVAGKNIRSVVGNMGWNLKLYDTGYLNEGNASPGYAIIPMLDVKRRQLGSRR